MGVEIQQINLQGTPSVVIDLDSDATSENNVNSGAATPYWFVIENGDSLKEYTKVWDNTAPTVGTTANDLSFMTQPDSTLTVGIDFGVSLGTALSFATVSDGGGTAGTTAPVGNVKVMVVTD